MANSKNLKRKKKTGAHLCKKSLGSDFRMLLSDWSINRTFWNWVFFGYSYEIRQFYVYYRVMRPSEHDGGIFLYEIHFFLDFEIIKSPKWTPEETKTRKRKIWRKTWRQIRRSSRSKWSNQLVVQLVDWSTSRKWKSRRDYSTGTILYGPYTRTKIYDS